MKTELFVALMSGKEYRHFWVFVVVLVAVNLCAFLYSCLTHYTCLPSQCAVCADSISETENSSCFTVEENTISSCKEKHC